jgi:choline dehydrogenase
MHAEQFDYVIVGGGSSGCALAGRLAQDGRHSVAVLEAGEVQRPKISAVPAALVRTIGDKRYDWQYLCETDPTRQGRQEPWPRGLGPGGSGLINGMIFVRGAPADYDAWRELGARGWGYDDVLPYFKRLERSAVGAADMRGRTGRQHVSALRYVHPVTDLFVASAQAAGIPFTHDYTGHLQDGVGYVQATQKFGRRHSPYDAFLEPALRAGRVTLLQGARAQRVVFEGRSATGVQYLRDGELRTVRAARKVVLCGGSINTPHLLMLSGIGDATHLAAMGITARVDAPEVGANLMEHCGTWLRAELNVPTLNQHATRAGRALAMANWVRGAGPATTPTAQALAFARTRPDLPGPDLQLHFAAFGFTGPAQTDPAQRLVMVVPSVNHPRSRGAVRLASGDPMAAPRILPRLLDAPEDLDTMRRGVRLCASIMRQAPMLANFVRFMEPPPLDGPDEALDDFVRQAAGPLYHPVGTCRMGRDASAVVDPELNVRGVERLAVADVSIMPRHISGNTHACALMIGERAADLLGRP